MELLGYFSGSTSYIGTNKLPQIIQDIQEVSNVEGRY
jgi:hypothetical protein